MKATKPFVLQVVLSLIVVSRASAAESPHDTTPLVAQPVRFEPNVGQSRSTAPFIAHGAGYQLQVDQGSLRLAFSAAAGRQNVVLSLDGAQCKRAVTAEELLDSKINYYCLAGPARMTKLHIVLRSRASKTVLTPNSGIAV